MGGAPWSCLGMHSEALTQDKRERTSEYFGSSNVVHAYIDRYYILGCCLFSRENVEKRKCYEAASLRIPSDFVTSTPCFLFYTSTKEAVSRAQAFYGREL